MIFLNRDVAINLSLEAEYKSMDSNYETFILSCLLVKGGVIDLNFDEYVNVGVIHFRSVYPELTKDDALLMVQWSIVNSLTNANWHDIEVSNLVISDYLEFITVEDLPYEILYVNYLSDKEGCKTPLLKRITELLSDVLAFQQYQLKKAIMQRNVRLLSGDDMTPEAFNDLMDTYPLKLLLELPDMFNREITPDVVTEIVDVYMVPSLTRHTKAHYGKEPIDFHTEFLSTFKELYPLLYKGKAEEILEFIELCNIPLLQTFNVFMNETLLSIIMLNFFDKTELSKKLKMR